LWEQIFKKMQIKKSFFLIVCLLVLVMKQLFAQTEEATNELLTPRGDSTAYVIALSGLNMREQPDFSGKIIHKIPFGAELYRLAPPDLLLELESKLIYDKDSIPGLWEQVRFSDKTGWIFNAYIARVRIKMEKASYLLKENSGWCWSDAFASSRYYYYGLFLSKDSTQAEFRRIQPIFAKRPHDDGAVYVRTNSKSRTLFLFASSVPVPWEGMVSGHHIMAKAGDSKQSAYRISNFDSAHQHQTVAIPKSTLELFVKTNTEGEGQAWVRQTLFIRNKANGIEQRVPFEHVEYANVNWCGDLNRDGITDFLIQVSCGKEGALLLYLSGNTGKGQVMRLAGWYAGGGCC
jgi:hypothetical protein